MFDKILKIIFVLQIMSLILVGYLTIFMVVINSAIESIILCFVGIVFISISIEKTKKLLF